MNFTIDDPHILRRYLSLRGRIEDFQIVGKLKTVTDENIEEKTIKKKMSGIESQGPLNISGWEAEALGWEAKNKQGDWRKVGMQDAHPAQTASVHAVSTSC